MHWRRKALKSWGLQRLTAFISIKKSNSYEEVAKSRGRSPWRYVGQHSNHKLGILHTVNTTCSDDYLNNVIVIINKIKWCKSLDVFY